MNSTAFQLAAVALSMTLGAAAAQAGEAHARSYVMGEQAISQITTYAGYDVVDIDLEGDVYHVEAFEPAGKRIELRYLAKDGSLVSIRDARHDARRLAARD